MTSAENTITTTNATNDTQRLIVSSSQVAPDPRRQLDPGSDRVSLSSSLDLVKLGTPRIRSRNRTSPLHLGLQPHPLDLELGTKPPLAHGSEPLWEMTSRIVGYDLAVWTVLPAKKQHAKQAQKERRCNQHQPVP
jgi:hypothetical protein